MNNTNSNPNLIEYYESILNDSETIIHKINEVKSYASAALKFWKEYENPNINIAEIFPPKVEGTNNYKQSPYYRAQSSYTDNGKKTRITCYLGTMDEYPQGKSDPNLIEEAKTKIRQLMKEKSNHPTSFIGILEEHDNYFEKNFSFFAWIRRIANRRGSVSMIDRFRK